MLIFARWSTTALSLRRSVIQTRSHTMHYYPIPTMTSIHTFISVYPRASNDDTVSVTYSASHSSQ